MIKLYQIVNNKTENRVCASPWVIATELFLIHKKLEFEVIPLNYTEIGPTISNLTNQEWNKVPTLVFPNGDIIFDSAKIAQYLDDHYPTSNQIIKNINLDQLISEYDKAVSTSLTQITILPLYNTLDNDNQIYFRNWLEGVFKAKLEDIPSEKLSNIEKFYNGSECLVPFLSESKFLDGEVAGIHDYYIISRLESFKVICPEIFYEMMRNHPSELIRDWVDKMHNLFDNYLKNRKTL